MDHFFQRCVDQLFSVGNTERFPDAGIEEHKKLTREAENHQADVDRLADLIGGSWRAKDLTPICTSRSPKDLSVKYYFVQWPNAAIEDGGEPLADRLCAAETQKRDGHDFESAEAPAVERVDGTGLVFQ